MGMFSETKTLIVVSKDEMLKNQFKKLVESNEKYESVKLVVWTDKVWLANKKSGNIDSRVIFLGDVKGTDKLIPVIDEHFSTHGVKYGWAGKQAVLYADLKELNNIEKYESFYSDLIELPVPEVIKKKAGEIKNKKEIETDTLDENSILEENGFVEFDEQGKFNPIKKLGHVLRDGGDIAENVFTHAKDGVNSFTQEVFKNRHLIKKQMLFFGVVKICDEGLDKFMNI